MITGKSNHNISPRKTKKYSDKAIFWGSHTTPFWKTFLFKSRAEAIAMLLGQYMKFNKAFMAFVFWGVNRFKAGSQTTGLILSAAALCFLLSFNSSHVPLLLKPFALFIVPFVPFWNTQEELYQLIFVDVESQFVLYYTLLLAVSSAIHVVLIWFKKGNLSITKRGESFLYAGLSKFIRVDEYFIAGIIDPLIGIGIGILAWHFADDYYFCALMILCSLAEASQMLLDESYRAQNRSILNA